MIRPPGYLPLAVALLFLSPVACSADAVTVGVYPVPVVEMKEQVTDWFQREGFRIVGEDEDDGGVSLQCEKASRVLRVQITPRSPMASTVQMDTPSGSGDGAPVIAGLREFLAAHAPDAVVQRRPGYRGVPRAVERNENAVFCLRASSHGTPVGFSGFAIDRRGFIISTAHDLEGIRRVTVWLKNGVEAPGEVVWRDVRRDLSLIRVKSALGVVVSLGNGRRSPLPGERIYLLPCVTEGRDSARFGTVGEKPALVNGQPLWQVNLHVSPGTSGSPVFDADGRLVGMVKGRFRGAGTRGFLIPLDTIREFLRKDGR
jgi:serine protease Do